MRITHNISVYLFTILTGLYFPGKGQCQTLKFPITQEGIYKINPAQANSLGIGPVSEISIFGKAGMLDQKLDTSFMDFQEIPSMEINGELFVFLSTADQVVPEGNSYTLKPHIYTDTLYYLLRGRQAEPLRIAVESPYPDIGTIEENLTWLLMRTYKQEAFNLLGSGRNWYGHRVLGGQQFSITTPKPSGFAIGPSWIKAEVMAQSLSESAFELSIDGIQSASLSLPSIPNSTYGIKGREGTMILNHSGSPSSQLSLQFSYSSTDRNGTGYLKHIIAGFPADLSAITNQVVYRSPDNESAARLSIPDSKKLWDVSLAGNSIDRSHSKASAAETWKMAIFDPVSVPLISETTMADMSLQESSDFPEFIIVSPPVFLNQANRLATFKRSMGISTMVVTPSQMYDGYGYGNRDITAFRNFLASQFHQGNKLKNVLFFGKGTFDYKQITQGQPNLVPTYSSRSSLNPLTSYSSDDYFGFFDVGAGEWEENNSGDHQLRVGIGRIPATNVREAGEAVDKIIRYTNLETTLGDWKSTIMLLADDGDNNIHLRDAEAHATFLQANHPEFTLDKIYLDKYEQINTGNSQTSPAARAAISDWVSESGLIINYIGHGNETTLAAERLWVSSDLADWSETARLPLFVTASCEFGRHDSPFIRSGAEELLFANRKGAIALLTTGRPVFSSINFELNKAFFAAVFQRSAGNYLTLGEIFSLTKNNSLNGPLNRNFSLLGDPSLTLNLPEFGAENKTFTDIQLDVQVDTLQALQRIRYQGQIKDPFTGSLIPTFNGNFAVSLTDKPQILETLGDESAPTTFEESNAFIHLGTGDVIDGIFEGELMVGRNIKYDIGQGTLKVFATDLTQVREAMGASRVFIGGSYPKPIADQAGPKIGIYTADSSAIPTTIPSKQLPIILTFEDESGINISAVNIGQNLRLVVNQREEINLNSLFRAVDGGYARGYVPFTLSGLHEGNNQIEIVAFDNQGNRSVLTKTIEVVGSESLRISSVLTYPNPAINQSNFVISHNRPGEHIQVKLTVFSVSGHEIFSTDDRFPNADSSIKDLDWIFLHDKTKYPAKGTYIYRLELVSEADGSTDQLGGKIIIQ